MGLGLKPRGALDVEQLDYGVLADQQPFRRFQLRLQKLFVSPQPPLVALQLDAGGCHLSEPLSGGGVVVRHGMNSHKL